MSQLHQKRCVGIVLLHLLHTVFPSFFVYILGIAMHFIIYLLDAEIISASLLLGSVKSFSVCLFVCLLDAEIYFGIYLARLR